MEDIIFSAKQVQGKKALFGKGRFALQNVDFELPSGYIMGIIGENGAGKTTFFRYIMEEKKHYRGSFYLDGTDIAEDHAWSMNWGSGDKQTAETHRVQVLSGIPHESRRSG